MTVARSPLLYNQNTLGDDDFVANFVARHDVLDALVRRLHAVSKEDGGLHHVLIGSRGMGKTSLLRRIAIAINREADLAARYIPLNFREEQYNVLTLGDFWRNCGEALAEWAEATGQEDLAAHLDHALASPTWNSDESSAEQFVAEVTRLGRRAVLLVDNIDLILDAFSDNDQWALRRRLQARSGPIMIGAATRPLQQATDREAAFYEFFQPHHLEPLDERETETCMRALARRRGDSGKHVLQVLDKQPERLRTLHTLTGGNPRILALIYRLLESEESEAAMADLEILLDQVTPYYKARIEEYQTPQQRAVIDAIALSWDPITTGALSRATNVASTTLSPLLIKLRKDGLIESVDTSGSYAGHQLVERFLNIWYLMRYGTRRIKQRMRWLVGFLTSFYSSSDLIELARHATSAHPNRRWHKDYKLAFDEAIAQKTSNKGSHNSDNPSREALAIADVADHSVDDSSENVDIHVVNKVFVVRDRFLASWNLGNFADCIAALDELLALVGDAEEPVLRDQVANALLSKGDTLSRMGDHAAAVTVYDNFLIRFADADKSNLSRKVAVALNHKGVALAKSGDRMAAIAAFDMVLTRFGDIETPALREQVARALFNKAVALRHMGDGDGEIELYDALSARFDNAKTPALREQVARALFSKGVALGRRGDRAGELAAYDVLLTRFGDAKEPTLREQVAKALLNKGVTLSRMGDSAGEIAAYDTLWARFSDAEEPALRRQLAMALAYKGATLEDMGDTAAALAAFDTVLARFDDSEEKILHEPIAVALAYKGITLRDMGDSLAAIAEFDAVLSRFGGSEEPGLRRQAASALLNKGIVLNQMNDTAGEIAAYDVLLSRFGEAEETAVREQVAKALVNKGVALSRLGDTAGEIAVYDTLVTRFGDAQEPTLRKQVALALVYKGFTLGDLGDSQATITAFDAVLARFGDAEEPELREQVASALVYKGIALDDMGERAAAIAEFDAVVARFGHSEALAIRDQVALAMVSRGSALYEMGANMAAIAGFDAVVARHRDATEPELLAHVAMALLRKAGVLRDSGESEAAIAALEQALALLGDQRDRVWPTITANIQAALANVLFEAQGENVRAEALYKSAAPAEPLLANANLAWLYLLTDRIADALEARKSLDEMPAYGLSLLDAGLDLFWDNFGAATQHLAKVFDGTLDMGDMSFSDDLERLLRLAAQKGHAERLLTWFETTSFADRVAPIYAALRAYVRGERTLLDINLEVRRPAQLIFERLDAPRRNRPASPNEKATGKRGPGKRRGSKTKH